MPQASRLLAPAISGKLGVNNHPASSNELKRSRSFDASAARSSSMAKACEGAYAFTRVVCAEKRKPTSPDRCVGVCGEEFLRWLEVYR